MLKLDNNLWAFLLILMIYLYAKLFSRDPEVMYPLYNVHRGDSRQHYQFIAFKLHLDIP